MHARYAHMRMRRCVPAPTNEHARCLHARQTWGSVTCMQATNAGARTHFLSVDPVRLDKLRDAHGIQTDAEFARLIGVDDSTLRRVRTGATVASNEFLAKLAAAFPHASFDSLFVLRTAEDARSAEAGA